MRKITYSCDHCDKELEDSDHLNVKELVVYKCTKQVGGWHQEALINTNQPNRELHFCNRDCLTNSIALEVG